MLMVRSPESRNCLQVTFVRSSFCADAGVATTSDIVTSDMATITALMVFTGRFLDDNPARTTLSAADCGGQSHSPVMALTMTAAAYSGTFPLRPDRSRDALERTLTKLAHP